MPAEPHRCVEMGNDCVKIAFVNFDPARSDVVAMRPVISRLEFKSFNAADISDFPVEHIAKRVGVRENDVVNQRLA